MKCKNIQFINLNKLEKKTKKLFNLSPEQMPAIFGYRNYFALLNMYDSRGAYTPTEKEKEDGVLSSCTNYVLMEIVLKLLL